MNRFLIVPCAFLVGAVVALSLGKPENALADCPTSNGCTLYTGQNVEVVDEGEDLGHFTFDILFAWNVTQDPAWVTVDLYPGAPGINTTNVQYTPAFLQNQNCVDNATFACEGDLQNTNQDGVVNTRANAGNVPNNCVEVRETFIPHV